MNFLTKYIILILIAIFTLGCPSRSPEINRTQPVIQPHKPPPEPATPIKTIPIKKQHTIRAKIMNEYIKWEGTPHKMGGYSKKGIDCSGFAHYIYTNLFHINVPRSTKQFLVAGVQVKKSQLKPGDIVLFTPHSYPRHMGIYVGNNKFIHSSSSKGVIISDLDNPYWKKYYKMSRRILDSNIY